MIVYDITTLFCAEEEVGFGRMVGREHWVLLGVCWMASQPSCFSLFWENRLYWQFEVIWLGYCYHKHPLSYSLLTWVKLWASHSLYNHPLYVNCYENCFVLISSLPQCDQLELCYCCDLWPQVQAHITRFSDSPLSVSLIMYLYYRIQMQFLRSRIWVPGGILNLGHKLKTKIQLTGRMSTSGSRVNLL